MIVKRTPGYLSYLQKLVERIVLPQFVDNSDLIPYRTKWICPYISRHLLSLNPLLARCRRYSRGER